MNSGTTENGGRETIIQKASPLCSPIVAECVDDWYRIAAEAERVAKINHIEIAVGYQTNDITGIDELGYCPLSAIGIAFVHTVLYTVKP